MGSGNVVGTWRDKLTVELCEGGDGDGSLERRAFPV